MIFNILANFSRKGTKFAQYLLICFNFVVGVFSVNCSYMKAFRILLFLTGLLFETVTAQTITELMSKEKIAQNKIETITQYTHRLQNGNVDSKGYKSVETTYDKQGNSIEVVNYKPNGTVSSRHLYKYNDKDQKIEYQQFQDLPGKGFALAFRQAFTYDPKGNKLTEIGYDGRTTYRIAYTYTAMVNKRISPNTQQTLLAGTRRLHRSSITRAVPLLLFR